MEGADRWMVKGDGGARLAGGRAGRCWVCVSFDVLLFTFFKREQRHGDIFSVPVFIFPWTATFTVNKNKAKGRCEQHFKTRISNSSSLGAVEEYV